MDSTCLITSIVDPWIHACQLICLCRPECPDYAPEESQQRQIKGRERCGGRGEGGRGRKGEGRREEGGKGDWEGSEGGGEEGGRWTYISRAHQTTHGGERKKLMNHIFISLAEWYNVWCNITSSHSNQLIACITHSSTRDSNISDQLCLHPFRFF